MLKLKNSLQYYIERCYPYCCSLLVVFLLHRKELRLFEDVGYKELLNGLVTLDSIIIGFLGAMIPVILSMKNESKFVRYVFQNDTEGLFSKYMKATIFLGLLNAGVSLVLYVRNSLDEGLVNEIYYLWLFITVAFLLCTYRSMSHMINLVFRKDESLPEEEKKQTISTERERELKNKYKKKAE